MPEYRWNESEHATGYDQAAQHIHPYYTEIRFYREICGLMLRYRTTSVYGPRLGELSDWT